MGMMFSGNFVNNNVVDNLLICLVLKFYDYRPNGVRVIGSRNMLSDWLVLWIDLKGVIV